MTSHWNAFGKSVVGITVLLAVTALMSAMALAQADVGIHGITNSKSLVHLGENFNYSVSVYNWGPQPALDVMVSISLPPDVAYVSYSGSGWTCSVAGPSVSCSYAGPAQWAWPSNITITVKAPDVETTVSGLGASVSASTPDPNMGNNWKGHYGVITVTDMADVGIHGITNSKSLVQPGENFNYSVSVYNWGPQPALGVMVSISLPPDVAYVSYSGSGWTCSVAGPSVSCSYAGPAQWAWPSNITITVKAAATCSQYIAHAAITSSNPDPNLANNNKSSGVTNVSPCDSSPPTIMQDDIFVSASATHGADGGTAVSFSPTVTDDVDVGLTATCVPVSGSVFPVGGTEVACTATDSSGSTGTHSFTISVSDDSPPVLTGSLVTPRYANASTLVTMTVTVTDNVGVAHVSTWASFGASLIGRDFSGYCTPGLETAPTSTTCTVTEPIPPLSPEGEYAIWMKVEDAAVNVGTTEPITHQLFVDFTKPTITAVLTKADGDSYIPGTWSNQGIYVDYICTDSSGGSGIAMDDYAAAVDWTFDEGADQSHTAAGSGCVDLAGNEADPLVVSDIHVDLTAPTIVQAPIRVSASATHTADGGTVVFFLPEVMDNEDVELVASCEPASGTRFALGATGVNCEATDSAGNTGTHFFNVRVWDESPPVLTNSSVTPRYANASTFVTMTVTVTDNVGVDLVLALGQVGELVIERNLSPFCNPSLDLTPTSTTCTATLMVPNQLPEGDYTLWMMAYDRGNNEGTTVPTSHMLSYDVTKPTITAVLTKADGESYTLGTWSNQSVNVDYVCADSPGGSGIAVDDYAAAVDWTFDEGADQSHTAAGSGCVDNAGNEADPLVVSDIDVDLTAPLNPVLGSTSHTVDVWSNDSFVDITASGASDAVSGVDGFYFGLNQSPDWMCAQGKDAEETWTGNTFAAASDGDWWFHICTADNAGNWSDAAHLGPFKIDTTAPVIEAHADVGPIEATGPAGAVVTYASPDATDAVDGVFTATCEPLSGSTFPVGNSTVTCNASDTAGNAALPISFNVTVQDTTVPILANIPQNQAVIESITGGGMVVDYPLPTASDTVDLFPEVSCAPQSGSLFPLGDTTVTCTATDDSGNQALAGFVITVLTPAEAVIALLDYIEDTVGENSVAAPLKQIGNLLQDGNTTNDGAVCNKLTAFIGIVETKRDQGRLSDLEAQDLITSATEIMASVGCQMSES